MQDEVTKMSAMDTHRLNIGKLGKSFDQIPANSTAYFSQFEYSNYEEIEEDWKRTANITSHQDANSNTTD